MEKSSSYIGRVIYYVALLIDNEHHSHSLEFLSEPELSLYTCRAVGSCLLHILFVSECFFCPRDFEGKSGISWPKVCVSPPCPPDAVLHNSSATSEEELAERRHILILCFTSKHCGSLTTSININFNFISVNYKCISVLTSIQTAIKKLQCYLFIVSF